MRRALRQAGVARCLLKGGSVKELAEQIIETASARNGRPTEGTSLMTARKQIKKQHKLAREQERRSLDRSQTRRRLMGFGAAALAITIVVALAFALAPWSGSGEADESLPSVALSIGDNYFDPETLRIDAGQKYRLEIQNLGLDIHDVWMAGSDNKTGTGDDIRTDPISPGGGATEKMKFENPGTYYFVCTFHGGQGGTVIVEEPASPERSPD